jgi:MFS superfamily sulfate permease-like transporter
VATAAAIIALPIEQGVAIGIILSLLHGIWSTTRARLVVFERVPGTTIWWPASPHMKRELVPNATVVGMHAPLSFLNAESFKADALKILQAEKPRLLVIEASGMPEIDFTAAQNLLELFRECEKSEVTVAIARLESPRAQEAFERFRIYEALPRNHVFRSVAEAVAALAK